MAFVKRGVIARALERGIPYPYLAVDRSWTTDARAARERSVERVVEVERPSSSSSSSSSSSGSVVESDAVVRYDRSTLLELRASALAKGAPVGTSEEERAAYPWRATEASARDGSSVSTTVRTVVGVDAETDDVRVDADDYAIPDDDDAMRSMFQDGEAYVHAARFMRAADARASSMTSTSGSVRVTFRDGAMRTFVRKTMRERFGGHVNRDHRETTRAQVTGILYGTTRFVDGTREISVAFAHPWDGDILNVVSWLASQTSAAETTVVSPVGWLRANASLGASLPSEVTSAYENALALKSSTSASAVRLFVSLDVLTSACGPLVMECYDLKTKEEVEFSLNGDDCAMWDSTVPVDVD